MKWHTMKRFLLTGSISLLALSSPAYATLKEALEAINDHDYAFALEELNRLMSQENNTDARYHLGRMYEQGLGVEKNEEKALGYYRTAAEKENEKAALKLGNAYYTGGLLDKDYKEALKWYTIAADKGSYPAQYNVGLMYEEGNGVKKDFVQAFKFYKKSAEQGYAPAQIALGRMFLKGIGTPQDYSQAIFWYKLGADQGDQDAQMRLAKLYANSTVRGLPFNIVGAHVYFNLISAYGTSPLKEEAAQLRDALTQTMRNEDVVLAQKKANKWRKKKREESLPNQNAESLIDDDDDFMGDVKNKSKEQKEEIAKIEVGVQTTMQDLLVAAGISRRDLNKAVRADDFSEIEKTLKENESDRLALIALADLYVLGQGLKENPKEALKIYKKLAAKNDPIAFYRLAPMYCEGNSIEPDLSECYKYMLLAKKYSDDVSLPAIQDALQMLDENLDKEIRDIGKKLAEEWGQKETKSSSGESKKKKRFSLFGGDKKEDDEKENKKAAKEDAGKEEKAKEKPKKPAFDDDDLFSGL